MSEALEPDLDQFSASRILDGHLTLWQPRKGYRAGLDAALLAAACDSEAGERWIEPGCGVGGALLQAAYRHERTRFVGVERDPAAAALARQNVTQNNLSHRVEVVVGDIGAAFAKLDMEVFDGAFANPPFFDDPRALRPPAPEKRGAWMADHGLGAWIGFMVGAVRRGGSLLLIHRADRLADLLASLSPRAGSFQIRPVHPFADAPAKRILVRARLGGRAPLQILPPLVLHERGSASKHHPEADALLRGQTRLHWA